MKLELLRQMTEEGNQDYMRAADFVRTELYPKQNTTSEKKSQNAQAQEARNEINAISGSSHQTISDDDLVQRSRKGDRDAIYERLKRSGF